MSVVGRLHSLRSELELVRLHVYAPPAEAHAFGFQPQPLFNRGIPTQLDLAAGAEHALPGQSERSMQHSRYLPCAMGQSSRASHGPVGRNLSAWDFLDGCANRRGR